MKMKPLFKRITSVVLTLLMVLSAVLSPLPGDFFTRFVEAAETYVVKKEQLAQGLNVLPVVLADDEYFLNSYVRKNGTTMSINSSLLTVEKNDIDPGEYLTINTMGRKSNGNGQWQASFATAIPSPTPSIIDKSLSLSPIAAMFSRGIPTISDKTLMPLSLNLGKPLRDSYP